MNHPYSVKYFNFDGIEILQLNKQDAKIIIKDVFIDNLLGNADLINSLDLDTDELLAFIRSGKIPNIIKLEHPLFESKNLEILDNAVEDIYNLIYACYEDKGYNLH